jgi:hypothetical protein
MPPQQGDGLLDIVNGAGNFGAHGGDIGRTGWKVKLFNWVARTRFTPLRGVRWRAMTG